MNQQEDRKLPETLQFVRTDLDNCRVYYKRGNTLYAFQRERADDFQLYECTSAGEPMVIVPVRAIDRKPDDYPEFVRWVHQGHILKAVTAVAGELPEARVIRLAAYDIAVTFTPEGAGRITSSLHDDGESSEAKAALDGVESMILAHALAGIDVNTPAYLEGIETAVEAIWNHHGD